MYRAIDAKQCMVDKFATELAEQNLFSGEQCEEFTKEYTQELKRELEAVDSGQTKPMFDLFGIF